MVTRLLKHLFMPDWIALHPFPQAALRRIGEAIAQSEKRHRGEVRFALEAGLPPAQLKSGTRARARQVFAELGVWDTEENSGVLIYVELVDRRIEIVADRGIAQRVAQAEWDAICQGMQRAFKENRYEAGVLEAIGAVTGVLAKHFPAREANPNELPDKPAVL
jgi:uncharacterized membrane protein